MQHSGDQQHSKANQRGPCFCLLSQHPLTNKIENYRINIFSRTLLHFASQTQLCPLSSDHSLRKGNPVQVHQKDSGWEDEAEAAVEAEQNHRLQIVQRVVVLNWHVEPLLEQHVVHSAHHQQGSLDAPHDGSPEELHVQQHHRLQGTADEHAVSQRHQGSHDACHEEESYFAVEDEGEVVGELGVVHWLKLLLDEEEGVDSCVGGELLEKTRELVRRMLTLRRAVMASLPFIRLLYREERIRRAGWNFQKCEL